MFLESWSKVSLKSRWSEKILSSMLRIIKQKRCKRTKSRNHIQQRSRATRFPLPNTKREERAATIQRAHRLACHKGNFRVRVGRNDVVAAYWSARESVGIARERAPPCQALSTSAWRTRSSGLRYFSTSFRIHRISSPGGLGVDTGSPERLWYPLASTRPR